ncbi:ABC-type multidrug/protein/lipid transport system ATP-binding and permease protein [Candidatus Phytoplasma luffae]|uniref:ABC-type multidrug/protein/lipid transport system ATP-binding and permease protein n=1 Tax=Loofah witches'-broom phytoplasma TaxID=35773 RepID=A0A975INU9_LOWBP|nr:ABC transporter ATP-binding protein [Candidatus Phytoplasma luffae]QTX03291.1 ABC-type multidrug/protein/lipid transport system ATP-binding and permease protein [Candidatus Phytoplasma luffae]
MKKIFSYLKPFRKKITISISIIFIIAIVQSMIPLLEGKQIFQYIKNYYVDGSEENEAKYKKHIISFLLFILALYFCCFLGKFIYNKLLVTTIHKSVQNIRQDIYMKINKLPIKYFDQNTVGDIMNKLTNNMDIVSNGLQQTFASSIYSFFRITMLLTCMFWVHWRLGLIVFFMIPSSFLIIFIINKKTRNIFIERFNQTSIYNSFLQEKLTGHKEILLYNQQENSIKEFKKINQNLSDFMFKSNFFSNITFPIVNFIKYFILAIIIIISQQLLYKGSSDTTTILYKLGFVGIQLYIFQSFIEYIWALGGPINELSHIFVVIQSTKAAMYKISEFLSEYEEKDNPETITIDKAEGYVNFDNVSFGYHPNKFIIENMNLSVEKNQTIAIVGSTGSGKTTLINLLTRFYDIDKGSITIDGIDIRNLTKQNLRTIVGLVLQDIWLFPDTILENIKYGNPNKTDEEAIEMAKQTHLHEFVIQKEKGYNTVLNEELNNLSQGEKQLITITRTLLQDPSILILDEATSTIDTQIELILQKSIQRILKNKTSFVIAHRLSTIVNADVIVVLQQGKIIEKGNHRELLEKKGFYYNLYQSQFQK